MQKKILFLAFILFFITPAAVLAKAETPKQKPVLFYGDGCPHCAKVEKFLKENKLDKNIEKKEIYHDPKNAEEFNQVCEEENIDLMKRGVPFLYTKNKCLIGDDQIISYFKNSTGKKEKNFKPQSPKDLTLLMLIGAALTDAVNPCAFAVLLILMTTILSSGKKKRALLAGLSFSASIFISYFLMGLGLYSVVASIQMSNLFIKIIAVLAIIIGLFNLKDFFWHGRGFLMEVPIGWRPKLKKIIQSIVSPAGAFLIGFLVSLFLLPCTSGPYIVIIGMLGYKATYLRAVWLLLLYNLIFVFPMLLITVFTYFGMDVGKAEERRIKNLRLLHLIAGLIMLSMGIYLLMNF